MRTVLSNRIIEIGDASLVPGTTSMNFVALGVNGLGEVVGTFGTTALDPTLGEIGPAFHWQPSRIRSNFGPGLTALTTVLAEAREINDEGVAVGFVGSVSDAYYWDLDTASDEGSFGLGNGSEAYSINDETPPQIVGGYLPSGDTEKAGFLLDFDASTPTKLEATTTSWEVIARDVSNVVDLTPETDSIVVVGLADQRVGGVGCMDGPLQECDSGWSWIEGASGVSENELDPLEAAPSDSRADALGVNDVGNVVGLSVTEISTLYRPRLAVFWESATSSSSGSPVVLGDDPGSSEPGGDPPPDDDEQVALAISDPLTRFDPDQLHVVGRSFVSFEALRWTAAVNSTSSWTPARLGDLTCLPDRWDRLGVGTDINDLGWIVGTGIIDASEPDGGGEDRAFLLIPSDYCPGDIAGPDMQVPDGVVDVIDLLTVLAAWGPVETCAIVDVDCDGEVGVTDLLAVLGNWNVCPEMPFSSPPSLSTELTNVGLDTDDWTDFLDVMSHGTEQEREEYLCWMNRYLSQCINCPSCPGSDPFD